jgi:hypothetical protein
MTKFDMIKAVKWLPDTKLIIAKKYVDTVFSTAVDYPYVTYGDKPRAIRMLHEGDWDAAWKVAVDATVDSDQEGFFVELTYQILHQQKVRPWRHDEA